MDIIDELLSDHRAMRDIVKELRSEASAPHRKRELLRTLGTYLSAHARGEARTIDEFGKRRADLRVLAYEDGEEHDTIQTLLGKLNKTRNTFLWAARVHLLCELTDHHLREEENEFFPLLQRALSADEAEHLALRYRSLTEDLTPLRPKPTGVLGWIAGRPDPAASESILL